MPAKREFSQTALWPFFWFFLFFLPACTSVFYQPDSYMHYPPEKLGLKKNEITFPSKDGTKLIAWILEPAVGPVKGTILQFHGNGENISSHYTLLAWLVRKGYRIFTFDYRGYGGSEGDPAPKGVYEDGLTALNEAWRRYGPSAKPKEKFILFGQSLGGAIAMRVLDDFKDRDSIPLVVMDSTFLSYKKVANRKLRESWLTWLFSPLGYILVSDEYSAKDSASKQKGRLLVIHDKRDPIVAFEFGQELYDLAMGPKDFWVLDQGRHIGVFYEDNQKERERFSTYLEALP